MGAAQHAKRGEAPMAKILVVEDEEKIARFIELELQHEGYETGKAADGRTGLEMAESDTYGHHAAAAQRAGGAAPAA